MARNEETGREEMISAEAKKEAAGREEINGSEHGKGVHENKMGVLPIKPLLFKMAWPAILSMTINALYNVVDRIFVSGIEGVGNDPMTAVTNVMPVHFFLIALAVGSGVGINSLIARRLGERLQEDADHAASVGIRIGMINYAVFLIIGVFFADIFTSFYAEKGTYLYDATKSYLQIICIGSFFLNVQICIEKILQGTGNMVAPMACSLTGAIVNIILDPILIFGYFGAPEMGIAGAAIATIIGQVCGFIAGVLILVYSKHQVKIRLWGYKVKWRIVGDIYRVGLPSIFMQSIGSIMLLLYNRILYVYEPNAVAVLGAYFSIQSFIFMPVFGLTQGAMPIMGYNYGAKNKARLVEAYKVGLVAAAVVMTVGTLLFQLFPDRFLMIFNADETMLRIGVPALRIISLSFIPAAFGILSGTMFQATGHGTYSLMVSMVRQLVGVLPICYILIRNFGVEASWAAFPLAEVLGIILTAFLMVNLYKKEIKNM